MLSNRRNIRAKGICLDAIAGALSGGERNGWLNLNTDKAGESKQFQISIAVKAFGISGTAKQRIAPSLSLYSIGHCLMRL